MALDQRLSLKGLKDDRSRRQPTNLRLRTLLLSLLAVLPVAAAAAHDSWINHGAFRSRETGEWCCGTADCAIIDPKSVALTSAGYRIDGYGTIEPTGRREYYREIVPQGETLPSQDGAYWRCRRPDGSRRCFFAPPPSS